MSNDDSNVARTDNKNLVDAAAHGRFHFLGKAPEAAGLAKVLKGSGPYIVLAPTDEAFEKLPKNTLDNWLKPENKAELISVPKYHVMPGRASGAEVEKIAAPKMMQGRTATVTRDGNKLQMDGATITQTDIASGNGVIHAIDRANVPGKQ